jgi:predicted TIM-barrel fold metal-dependent hydrolase
VSRTAVSFIGKASEEEISRLVAEHESEKNTLRQNFEKEKEKLLEEAMLEMNAGYKGLRQRLEKDNDKKSEEMDRKYREEIKRVSSARIIRFCVYVRVLCIRLLNVIIVLVTGGS